MTATIVGGKSLGRLIEAIDREEQQLAPGQRHEPERYVALLLAAVRNRSA